MVKKVKLPNGLRVVLVPQRDALTATALILVEAGSEYEKKPQNGISHFLEHMMFKGTVNRPKPGMISLELDGLGAAYNAFTGQEYTGYWAKVQAGKLRRTIDLLADLYLNPIFEQKEIDKERGVIIEEINMYADDPPDHIQEIFYKLLYGDQPAGWSVAGKKEVIYKLNANDFKAYRAERYRAPGTVVVVAGAFDASAVLKQIKQLFSHLPRKPLAKKSKTKEAQRKPAIALEYKKSDQTHMLIGVRAFDMFDPRRHALQLMGHILGGGMSSRLFYRIREELGAAYYVRADADLAIDHGAFVVAVGADNHKATIVLQAVLNEFRKLAKGPVGEAELKKARDHLIGNFTMGLETSNSIANFYGSQEISRRQARPPRELIAKLRTVTAKEIQAAAKAIFRNKGLNIAIIGPYRSTAPFKKLLKI